MSWQLASFLVIGAVLLGGFAWYERSRPPSQVVALVAALAALAIAGRIAFAALPNVKPTTDIVIFAGYALGAAPGFAVGALAGLVSNFWFGQGPWTPWQMAGWGMCGILGAALVLGGRNAGRLTLAAVCGFAGLAYGALLNFSLMATYGGDLSLRHFLVLEGRAVPFDLAHAAGNVTLALIAGPAMVRMLTRFRRRFEWGRAEPKRAAPPPGPGGMRPSPRGGGVAAALLVAAAISATVPARAAASGVGRAVHWLESAQNRDGGFGSSPGGDSSAAMTGWAMLGLEAAGRNPFDVARAGHTPVAFLRHDEREISSTGDLARTIIALEGAGADPRSFAGRNLVAELAKRQRRNGSFEGWPNDTAFSVIALRRAGAGAGIDAALSWLRKTQNDDGGWGDVPGSPSTADGTGSVMQALPDGSKATRRALAYLRGAQRPNGGFPLGGSGPVNSQSTGWAVQGMVAAGANPASIRRNGNSPLAYISARQASDGHYRYSAASDQTPVWVTGEVLVAAAKEDFPIAPPPRAHQSHPAHKRTAGTQSSASSSTTTAGTPPASPPSLSGGVGAPSERFAPQRPATSGAQAIPAPAGRRERRGSDTAQTATLASQRTDGTDSGSGPWIPLGIGLGIAALVVGSIWWLAKRHGW